MIEYNETTETETKRRGSGSALNCFVRYAQWVPIIGIPVSMFMPFSDKCRAESVIENYFWPSAMWHAVCFLLALLAIFHTST